MGSKLLWTGLTFIIAFQVWNPAGFPSVNIVGSVLMVIGLVLMWLDK